MFRFYSVFLVLYLFIPLKAQQAIISADAFDDKPDYNVISVQQESYLNSLYYRRINISEKQISGREYFPYYFKSKMKPLLFDEKKRSGSLVFNGRRYSNLSLEYDTFRDELIYSDSLEFIDDRLFKIALNKDAVDGFNLIFEDDSLTFLHFNAVISRACNIEEGFYEVAYNGATKFLIKHNSFIVEKSGLDEYHYFTIKYFKVGDNFSRVKSEKAFIKLFGKESDKVRTFMQTKGILFRKAGKYEIASILQYYDTLVMSNN